MKQWHEMDLIGRRFGRYVIIKEVDQDKHGNRRMLCRCDCGVEKEVLLNALLSGVSKSCGCFQKEVVSEANIKHGFYKERLYRVWAGMKDRCNNPNNSRYKNYGGRGIKVCKEWEEDYVAFRTFMLENGYDENAPYGQCTIDRIDNDGDYCPENCRIIDNRQQQINKPSTRKYEYHGKMLTIDEALEGKNITRSGVIWRLKKGWTLQDAIDTPLKKVKTYKVGNKDYTLNELAEKLGVTSNILYGRLLYNPLEVVIQRIIDEKGLDIKF